MSLHVLKNILVDFVIMFLMSCLVLFMVGFVGWGFILLAKYLIAIGFDPSVVIFWCLVLCLASIIALINAIIENT